MSDMNKQQAGVAAQTPQQQQQQPSQQQSQMTQQQVDGQTIQVQISHDGSDQMQGGQVASSNTTMNPTSTMVMAAPQQALISQQAMQNLQNAPAIAPMPSQGGSTTITTMSTGPPQQMADWPGHGRVQVIQQPIQNPTYIQPVYNAQGQLIVPGNIAMHPGDMNQPIQVIATGKAFQPGQMPHMLATAQGKPIVQGQTSFPGYATIPTSGNNQTLVISQLGVLGQTNILPQQQGKPQNMQKMITKTNVANNNIKAAPAQQQNVSIGNLVSSQPQGISSQAQTIIQPQIISPIQYTCNTQQQRTVPQGTTQAMQFAPWQATFGPTGLPQGLAWAPGAIQSSALLTQGSQIFIRNPQPEQAGMFIQNAQPSAVPQHNQMSGQQINKTNQAVEMGGNVQSKTPISKTFSAILPNSIGQQQFRPASSVSTQTGQTTVHQTAQVRAGTKVRTKNVCRMPSVATGQKVDAGNQTRGPTGVHAMQQKLATSSPGGVPQENKLMKQTSTPNQMSGGQQQQQQQPLAQIQQMQNIFQDTIDQKGQILVSNGIQNGGDRAVMPVVSMSPGQMAPIVGNMIAVQAVPGIAAMAPSLPIPAGQTVQGVPIAQEIIATGTNAVPVVASSQIKQEHKDLVNGQENGGMETGPGRPGEENTSGSEESLAPGNALAEGKLDRSQISESDDSVPEKGCEEKKDGGNTCQKATMLVKPQVLTHVIEGFVIQESSEPFPVNRTGVDGMIRKMPLGDRTESEEPPSKKAFLEGVKAEHEDDENKVNPMKWTVEDVCEFIRNLPGCADYVEDFAMQDIDGEALMLLKADHLMSAMSMKLGPAVKIIAKIDTMRTNAAAATKEGT